MHDHAAPNPFNTESKAKATTTKKMIDKKAESEVNALPDKLSFITDQSLNNLVVTGVFNSESKQVDDFIVMKTEVKTKPVPMAYEINKELDTQLQSMNKKQLNKFVL